MKSIFDMGFGGQTFGFARPIRLAGASLGQTPPTQAERDKLLTDLDAAIDKRNAIDAWVQTHPNAQAALGADFQAYQSAMSNSNVFNLNATIAYQKIAIDDPTHWNLSAQEWNDASSWIQAIGLAYDAVQKHPGGATAPAPGTPGVKPVTPGQAPAAVSSGPNPLAIGLGAAAAAALLVIVLS